VRVHGVLAKAVRSGHAVRGGLVAYWTGIASGLAAGLAATSGAGAGGWRGRAGRGRARGRPRGWRPL
jgi:hypothetical protein